MKKTKVIGLTGGIASGKTTFAHFLEKEGAVLIDLDKLGHLVYQPSEPAYREIIGAFGKFILDVDGHIDRKALSRIVFKDARSLAQLNAIVWPRIISLAKIKISEMQKDGEIIIVEGAVLIEAKCFDLFDEMWVVYTEPELAMARLCQRNGMGREEAELRLKAQADNATRLKYADRAVANNGSLEELKNQARELFLRCANSKG